MNKKILQITLFSFLCIFKSKCLDSTFGNAGIVTKQIIANNNAQINDIQLQTDGKIVAAGFVSSSTNSMFVIARYNTDGSLDSSFNTTGSIPGIVTTLIGTSCQANCLAIQPDGKIVVGGYSISPINNSSLLTIARYNIDGSLDTSFNSSGSVPGIVTGQDNSNINAIQIDASGNIVGAGAFVSNGTSGMLISRYTSSGVLDSTFNSTGIVTTLIGAQSAANSIAIQANGNIVVGGFGSSNVTQFTVARFNNDGSNDTTFGNNGIANTSIGNLAIINSLAIDNSGNIVVAGSSKFNNNDIITLARYTSIGNLDTTFNSTGTTPGILTQLIGDSSRAESLSIDVSGNIVISGYTNSDFLNFCVARFNSSGALDTTFGTNGIITTSIGNGARANAILIDNNGKILSGGFEIDPTSGNQFFALVRYNKNNTNSISITNLTDNSTITKKFISFSGTSSGNNSTVNVYLDGSIFATVTTDGSGNWSTGLTSLLADGTHLVRADLLDNLNNIIISAGLSFTINTSIVSAFAVGSTLRVDSVFGNDSNGTKNGPPFATINAALNQAVSGDTVWIFPGTYNENISNMPQGITIRGMATSQCIIQQANVTQPTDLITMNENCSLECLKLNLTSNNHVQLRGVVFPGTTSVTSRILECNLSVNNSAAGTSGTSNVYGIHSTGTGQPGTFVQAAVFSFILVNSAGAGNKRGILIDQANGFKAFQSVIGANSIGGTGSVIGVETNNASANFTAVESIVEGFSPTAGTYADISQTAGIITLSGSNLITITANSNPFTLVQYPKNFIFADSGIIAPTTTFLRPGTATATANEMQLRVSQAMIVKALSIRLANAPGTGNSVTWTVRKNGSNTAIAVTITDTNTTGLFNSASVNFAAGDLISISQVPSGANSASDVMAVVDFF